MDNAIANQALPINDEAKDFYGKTCQVQPNNEQLLVLTRGPFSAGCDLQNYTVPIHLEPAAPLTFCNCTKTRDHQ